jgi:hypothetical protein
LCKLLKAKRQEQLIGKVGEHKLFPSPPFRRVSVDLAGPFSVYASAKSRVLTKVWVVVYLCDNTRAIHLEIAEGYSSQALLTSLAIIFAVRNFPAEITSDPGTQMTAAGDVLGELSKGKISEKFPSIRWNVLPARTPHRNGGPEAVVKAVKASLRCVPIHGCTVQDFRAILAEISCSLNNRPLGFFGVNDVEPLTPNQLLLGRNQTNSGADLRPPVSYLESLQYVKEVHQVWWKRWQTKVLPSLFVNKRWKHPKPNVQVGDVCLVFGLKGKHEAGAYRYCRVLSTKEGSDNLVRTATVEMISRSKGGKLLRKPFDVDVRSLVILQSLGGEHPGVRLQEVT